MAHFKSLHTLVFLAILFLLMPTAKAQDYFIRTDSVPVYKNGDTLDLAWAGGMNSVQFSKIDLNGDGIEDLFAFDRTGNKKLTFINDGSPSTKAYHYDAAYEERFPDLHDWVLLEDYNCDGLKDIFTYSTGGIAIYRNSTPTNGALQFTLETNLLLSYQPPNNINLFVSSVDLPAICDLDNDGDLDILTFGVTGAYIEYHRNYSMENYGDCTHLEYELRNECWGYFSEDLNNNSVTLFDTCSFNVQNPEGTDVMELADMQRGARHTGSTLLAIDMDGDADKELVLGDISFRNLTVVYNAGTPVNAWMNQQDNSYPDGTTAAHVEIFPAAFHRDIDNDGIRDLIVSPNTPNISVNDESVWYYKNIGTDDVPVFNFVQEHLFQDEMIELGEGAYPVFFDYNNDGLDDLFISNYGVFNIGNTYTPSIALYENTGTAASPAFTFVTDDFENLSAIGLGEGMYPTFGDLDGDGDKDMMIGDISGNIHYFQNVAPIGQPADFSLAIANYPDFDNAIIDVGQFSTPQLFDVNRDGTLDLLIGERNGNVNYYENIGSSSAPSFRLMRDSLGGFAVSEYWNIIGYSVPMMYEEDTELKLLVGSLKGYLHLYDDIDGNVMGNYNLVDSMYLDINTGIRSAPALSDLNNDGLFDLVVGNYRGGVSFYRGSDTPTIGIAEHADAHILVYPNPANTTLTIELDEQLTGENYTIELYDLTGRVVATYQMGKDQYKTLPIADIPSSTYICRIAGASDAHSTLIVIQH